MTTGNNAGHFFFNSVYVNLLAQWLKIRHCVQGNEKIKQEGVLYLPKPAGLNTKQYNNYKARAVFYAVADRTVKTLVGASFQTDPIYDLPKNLESRKKALTPDGLTATAAIKKFVTEMLTLGRAGLLVDLPESETNDPPYMAVYKPEDITNWTREYINGKRQYTRVVIRESTDTNSGGTDVVRFLELLLTDGVYTVTEHFATFTRGNFGPDHVGEVTVGKTFTPSVAGKPLSEIPFIIGNVDTNGAEVNKSPLLDMCDINIAHYHNSADYEHVLFLLASPTPYLIGKLKKNQLPTKIGAGTFWHIDGDPNEVQIGFLEYTGTGSGDIREAMQDKESQMAALGARLIHRGEGPETAEAVRIKAGDSVSILDSVIINTEEAFNYGFRIMDLWGDSIQSNASVALNRDFIGRDTDVALFNAILAAFARNEISSEVKHEQLQKIKIIPEERTLQDEEKAIEKDKENKAENNPPPIPPAEPSDDDDGDDDGDDDED